MGSGENLNEHILGEHWPEPSLRLEMLDEAVEIIRELWQGKVYSHYGPYYTVENARLYTLPEQPPPIVMAASGSESADLAGRISDGLVSTSPDDSVPAAFAAAGGADKPRYGQLAVRARPRRAAPRTSGGPR